MFYELREYMIDFESFASIDFTKQAITSDKFDNCTFIDCNFEGKHLSELSFIECKFVECDLSNAKLGNTSLKDVTFENCKMIGLNFDDCNDFLFKVNFDTCTLNLSSFYKVNLGETHFTNCELKDVDFTEAILKNADFSGATLTNATFRQSDLTEADFTSAVDFDIDPNQNSIKKAKFTQANISGLLRNFDIIIF